MKATTKKMNTMNKCKQVDGTHEVNPHVLHRTGHETGLKHVLIIEVRVVEIAHWGSCHLGDSGYLADGPPCAGQNEGASGLIVLVTTAANEHQINELEPLTEGTYSSM